MKRLHVYTLLLVAVASTAFSLSALADTKIENPQMEDLSILTEAIAQFDYEGNTYSIWESRRNKNIKAQQWQFRYAPLFLPEMNKSGQPNIRVLEAPSGFIVKLPIILANEKTKAEAFRRVKSALPEEDASQIIPTNVSILDIRSIEIRIPSLEGIAGVQLPKGRLSHTSTVPKFSIDIGVKDRPTADKVAKSLPNLKIEYTYRYGAKQVRENFETIRFADLKKTQLFASLNGRGTTITYVHREDLRKLTMKAITEIVIDRQIEAPELYKASLFEDILKKLSSKSTSLTGDFDAQQLKATYNGDDLRPNVLKKTLNKIFTLDKGKNEWKRSGSGEVSGNASVVGVISGGASAKGSYTNEELQEWLKQNDIQVDIEGDQIVPKSIDLQQVNMSDFNSDQVVSSRLALLASSVQIKNDTLDLADLSDTLRSDTSLPGRVASLKNEIAPIGSIIAYGGPIGPTTSLPSNWRLCDGAVMDKNKFPALWNAIGYSWGGQGEAFNLPDLQGQFLRGLDKSGKIDPDGSSREIGSLQAHSLKSHNHIASASSVARTSGPPDAGKGGVGEGYLVLRSPRELSETGGGLGAPGGLFQDGNQRGISRANLEITVSVNNSDGTTETRPINRTVNWIIRVE